jgi:nucleoside-diphosphate-sugar epimerase
MPDPLLMTGSSGFIASHVRSVFGNAHGQRMVGLDLVPAAAFTAITADIRRPDELRQAAAIVRPACVIHLAARAEVVLPFDQLSDLMTTNVNGTINVLAVMNPDRIVFASSSSVYGNATGRGGAPRWSCVNPVGAYGMSKAAGELACAEWARQAGRVAVSLRIGNVVGTGCRGLIRYLVEHALAYPHGDVPAQLRSGGALARDYVPVDHVARAIQRAVDMPSKPGSVLTFNVGSGRGLTNRAVAEVVQRVVANHGLTLRMTFDLPRGRGEVTRVVLDSASSNDELGLAGPTEDDVIAAIEKAASSHLATSGKSAA